MQHHWKTGKGQGRADCPAESALLEGLHRLALPHSAVTPHQCDAKHDSAGCFAEHSGWLLHPGCPEALLGPACANCGWAEPVTGHLEIPLPFALILP